MDGEEMGGETRGFIHSLFNHPKKRVGRWGEETQRKTLPPTFTTFVTGVSVGRLTLIRVGLVTLRQGLSISIRFG